MTSENNTNWIRTAALRTIVASALIVVVTMFWVYLLFYTDLSILALSGIALVCLLLLSAASAWATTAIPRRESRGHHQDEGRNDQD